MSLINDAIKQANKANKERGSGDTAPAAGMQSADARNSRGTGGSMTGMIIVAGIVVFVLLGGVLLLLALRNTPLTTDLDGPAATQAATPSISPNAGPVTTQAPTLESTPRVDPVASAMTNPVPAPVGETAPSVTTTTTAGTPVSTGSRPFPELKLQGIYYRLNDPSVMINGKTLEIGDLILEAKVIKIERKEVTLEFDGQQKVLRLQ